MSVRNPPGHRSERSRRPTSYGFFCEGNVPVMPKLSFPLGRCAGDQSTQLHRESCLLSFMKRPTGMMFTTATGCVKTMSN
eukprot:5829632-Amphidinium_carterae.1